MEERNKMSTKRLSSAAFQWSHVGVILFHVAIASMIVAFSRYDKIGNTSSLDVLMYLGIILLVISVFSLTPIVMNNKYVIS